MIMNVKKTSVIILKTHGLELFTTVNEHKTLLIICDYTLKQPPIHLNECKRHSCYLRVVDLAFLLIRNSRILDQRENIDELILLVTQYSIIFLIKFDLSRI